MPRLHSTRDFSGQRFILAEKLDDYVSASVAQAEYWAMGYCCRKEPIQPLKGKGHWNVWLGPERKYKIRLLRGEKIERNKGQRLWRVG
jgi:hypothetical protein